MIRAFYKLADWYFDKKSLPFWCIFLLDCTVVFFSYLLTFQQFYGGVETLSIFWELTGSILSFLMFYAIGFRLFRTYSGILRYSSFVDLQRVGYAVLFGTVCTYTIHFIFYSYPLFYRVAGRVIIVASILATVIMWALRMFVKTLYDVSLASINSKYAFIYGVKSSGIGIAKHIRNEKPMRFQLKGFLTDDAEMANSMLMGVKVRLINKDTVELMKAQGIEAIIISSMRANEFRMNKELQDELINAGIHIYMIPEEREWKPGNTETIPLKEVDIEDLLTRDEIKVDMDKLRECFTGKSIMVTGSAGSIGSELVRQIASFTPASMTLVDQAETPQHDIRLMMHDAYPQVKVQTIVTSICKEKRMEDVFRHNHFDYVFHAAAYKHVPMMEDNPCESIQNNIYGTKIIADLSVKYGVQHFVMISTDKAVNPTNIMGCSKRICEIYVQSLSKAINEHKVEGCTQFVTTRFGNVLGSNGSVIPLFKKQILRGGPVTVTDPEIIRYFMLIPEACKLVLEAGCMGKGGEIFVFDMGKPVKIADLAKRMISLSGAKNVKIEYIGLRTGEKLYEEVLNSQETSMPSFNDKIRIAKVREYDYNTIKESIDELINISLKYDDMAVVKKMKQIVPEYRSNNSIYEQLDAPIK